MFQNRHQNNSEKSFSEREEYNTELLEKILELEVENNEILESLKKSEDRANLFRIIYWVFVLSALFGLFYYLKPVVDFIFQNFSIIKNILYDIASLSEKLPETNNIKSIIEQIKQ